MDFFQLFHLSLDKQMFLRANKKYNDIIKMALCSVRCFHTRLQAEILCLPSFQPKDLFSGIFKIL